MPIDFIRFGVRNVVTGAPEGANLVDVSRVRPDEQITDPRSSDLVRGFVAVHTRHRVVAFGQVSVFEYHIYLLVFRQIDGYRLFEFDAPDRFRAIRDESAVTLITLSQCSYRPGQLN
jgi:hypothetical protein